MIKRVCSLNFLSFKRISFLAALMAAMCILIGCGEEDTQPVLSTENATLTPDRAGTLPGLSPKTSLAKTLGFSPYMNTAGQDEDMLALIQLLNAIAASDGKVNNTSGKGLIEDNDIKIGLIVEHKENITPLYGAQLAVLEINLFGGVLGLPITLVVKAILDVEKDAEQAATKLITEDKVIAIIGPDYSDNAVAAAAVAQKYKVPMVTTGATNPDVTNAGDYVFLAAFSDEFQGKVLARFAREVLNAGTAAMLIAKNDLYSVGLGNFFDQNFAAFGGKVLSKETYTEWDVNYLLALAKIAITAPDVIFMPGYVPDITYAVKQARSVPQKNSSGISATFLGADGWEDPELVSLGGKEVEGSFFSTFFSPDTTSEYGHRFAVAYQALFGTDPTSYAAMGYDALRLVATAIRRGNSLNGKDIRDQLAATSNYKGATYIEKYNNNRHPVKSAVIMEVKNGRMQFNRQVQP